MDVAEARALQTAMDRFVRRFDEQHRFTAADIRNMHRTWLGDIYEWAGEYRSVNMSKDGFPFATAALIPELMQKFQKRILARVTPCRFAGREEVAGAMAEAHVELVLIHPFRDGNGRVARALKSHGVAGGPAAVRLQSDSGCTKDRILRGHPGWNGPELQANDKDLRGTYRAERRGDLTGRGPGTDGSDLAIVPALAPVSIAVDVDTAVMRSRR